MAGTEDRNPKTEDIDILPTGQILSLMNEEDAGVISAVRAAIPSIARLVDEAVEAVRAGGRIFYAGAGTSGRLGVLDASEMPPTFGVPPGLFRAIIAGGDAALRNAVEGAEDDSDAGRTAAGEITPKDVAVGISAGGKAPFVLSFLDAASHRGAACWLITCSTPESGAPDNRFRRILINTGPEVLAGSTRLKAGTATKLVLNMFSTALMVRLGRVYLGLMVDVMPTNQKLVDRAVRIVSTAAGCSPEEASKYLELAGMNPKVAVVMKVRGVGKEEAVRLIEEAGGYIRAVLGQPHA